MVTWTGPILEAINHRLSQVHVSYGQLSAFWTATTPKQARLTICRSYGVLVLLYRLPGKVSTCRKLGLKHIVSKGHRKTVFLRAEQPTLGGQQIQQLIKRLANPHNDPLHHVIFSPGHQDRFGIHKNSRRGPPPPHWLGLVSAGRWSTCNRRKTFWV